MSSNPGLVELWVLGTSVLSLLEPKRSITSSTTQTLLLSLCVPISSLKDSEFFRMFYCFFNFGTILIKRFRFYRNLLLFFEFRHYPYYSFFPDGRLELQISETASHSATKLNSYIDPYPTQCSERFGSDPDYHSSSRAKSVFSDSLHYLQNLSLDLQMQYL